MRAAFGGTINDVILAGVGSAVARLLDLRGELRPELTLKVFCPVSVRDDDQRMQLGNRISAMLVPLAVGEPDPLVRLAAVRRTTADLKERRQAVGAAALLGLSEYAAPTMLGLAARAAHAQRFANLIDHQHPRPAGAAVLPGGTDARGVPARPAVAEPHPQRGDPVVLRPAALRPGRRRRRRSRPRGRRRWDRGRVRGARAPSPRSRSSVAT